MRTTTEHVELAGERSSRNSYTGAHMPGMPCSGELPLPVPAWGFGEGLPLLSPFPIHLGTGRVL